MACGFVADVKEKNMNGKEKGNSFEREVSKLLSLFLSEGKEDDLLYRTASSGARYTSRKQRGKETRNQNGDITSINPKADDFINSVNIEVKHYKDIGLWSLFTGSSSSSILEFWKQVKRDSELTSKLPMLIVKQNYKPILFLTNETMYNILIGYFTYPKVQIRITDEIIYMYLLSDILLIDPKTFTEELKTWKNK